MNKYNLINGYVIKRFDSLNWILCREGFSVSKEGVESKENKNYDISYHGTIKGAWNSAVNKFALQAKDHEELLDTIKKLETLKFTIT